MQIGYVVLQCFDLKRNLSQFSMIGCTGCDKNALSQQYWLLRSGFEQVISGKNEMFILWPEKEKSGKLRHLPSLNYIDAHGFLKVFRNS